MSRVDADLSGVVTAGVASAALTGTNLSRTEITVCNDHATNVAYLQLATSFGTAPTAVVGQGIRLNAAGGSWTSSFWKGAVACIATGAATPLTITEF